MHVKRCSLMRSSPKPDVAIQSVSINDQMIQSNVVLPYISLEEFQIVNICRSVHSKSSFYGDGIIQTNKMTISIESTVIESNLPI